MDNKILQKMYFCEICNFKSKNKSNYVTHLNTKKHILTKSSMDNKKCKKMSYELWCCYCGKSYKFQSGLCKHKLKCNYIDTSNNITTTNTSNDVNNIVQQIVNENKEFKKLILVQQEQLKYQQEQMKTQSQQLSDIIPKIGNNNTTNQKFNINIFLNENCKNAINMSEFIDSIKISFNELDTISTTGLASGLSTAIINNIQRLKVEDRPIHCTDVKRETLYIKDNDEWARDISHQTITKAIKQLSAKPFFALQKWKCDNPEFMDDERKQEYFAKVLQAIGKSNIKVDDKIVKAICNHTYLKNK
jgi:hypothetical protein